MAPPRMPIEDRLWARVDKSGGPSACWLWQAGKDKDGYGKITAYNGRKGKCIRAHRLSWEIANGPVPDGAVVRHSCDTPACVNPSHLLIGTHKQNIADKLERGRARGNVRKRGDAGRPTKLSQEQVALIRATYRKGKRGLGYPALAARFGVGKTTVEHIISGKLS